MINLGITYESHNYHKMSPKHLQRYVDEFLSRHNNRDFDTIVQMGKVAENLVGKRLRYHDLVADNGLANGAKQVARKDAVL